MSSSESKAPQPEPTNTETLNSVFLGDINLHAQRARHDQKLDMKTLSGSSLHATKATAIQTTILAYFSGVLGSLSIEFGGKNLPEMAYTSIYQAIHHTAPSQAQVGHAVFHYMQGAFSGAAALFWAYALRSTYDSYKQKKDLEARIQNLAGSTEYVQKSKGALIQEAIKDNASVWVITLAITSAVGTAIVKNFNPLASHGAKGALHLSTAQTIQAVVPGFFFAAIEMFTAFMHFKAASKATQMLETIEKTDYKLERLINQEQITTVGEFLDSLILNLADQRQALREDPQNTNQQAKLKEAEALYNTFMHTYKDLNRNSGYTRNSQNVRDFIHASKASLTAECAFNKKAGFSHLAFGIFVFTAFALGHLTGIGMGVIGAAMLLACVSIGVRALINKYVKSQNRSRIFRDMKVHNGSEKTTPTTASVMMDSDTHQTSSSSEVDADIPCPA